MSGNKKQLSPRAAKIIGNILMILSVVALCFGGEQFIRGMNKRSEWCRAEAKVTHLEPVHGRRGRTSYKAWFAFRDPATNRSYSVRSTAASNPPAFRRGQRVEVLYPAEHPEEAVADTLMEVYYAAIFLGVAWVVLGVLGLALRFGRYTEGEGAAEQKSGFGRLLAGSLIAKLLSFPKAPQDKAEPEPPAEADTPDKPQS